MNYATLLCIALCLLIAWMIAIFGLLRYRRWYKQQKRAAEVWKNSRASLLDQLDEAHEARDAAIAVIERVRNVLPGDPSDVRHQIQIADWGPEYTGQDGTLTRWRWVVTDADDEVISIIDNKPWQRGWLMVGNSATPAHALIDAVSWCERDAHLPTIIIGWKPAEGPTSEPIGRR